MMFANDLVARAAELLWQCRQRKLRLVTAESCTGGLVAGLLTSIAGSSDVVEAGFVTYSNNAKSRLIGAAECLITMHGAVSEEVARAMAEGALVAVPDADISLAVTGVAGPGGGSAAKPVGLVYIAAARRGKTTIHRRLDLGSVGREAVRMRSVAAAIELALLQAAAAP